jgi:hypothetical protein
MALVGAIPKSIGATDASSYPLILANGFNPLSFAAYSLIKTKAQAPSFNLLELAAVIVPFLANDGLSNGNFSGMNFWHSSSLLIFLSLPLLSYSIMSTIS